MALPLCAQVLLGCTAARMAVPVGIVEQAELLMVTDRSVVGGAWADETFSLGEYRVIDVDRDWSHSSGIEAGPYSKEDTTGGVSFSYRAEEEVLGGSCTTASGVQEVEVVHPGRVWLSRSLSAEQRIQLTCLASALILAPSP